MRRALFLTAYNRPDYLAQTLESWARVRGLGRWHIVFRVEPSDVQDEILSLIDAFEQKADLASIETILNPERYGVLHHPWVGFEDLFGHFDFVARTEDDLLVATDILEYLEWASEHFQFDADVAAVLGYASGEAGASAADVVVEQWFSPLVWGTWRHRWVDVIRDTWDHDYSTFNGTPGNQAGWDWNLNTRVLPSLGLLCAHPAVSRSNHIGVHGVHGTAENFRITPSFVADQPPVLYRAVR